MEFITQTSIRLCRKGSSCCPIVELGESGFQVSDDFGGKVKLTEDQMEMLAEAATKLKSKKSTDA